MKNVLRTLIYNEQVSLTVADTTEIVREGIRLHNLSPASAYVFGKALSAMTFMSACLKEEGGEISLSLKTEGEAQEIAVSGNRALHIRGYINATQLAGGGNWESECRTLGKRGSLTIVRDDGYSRPFVGTCALPESGYLDEAFEEYFRTSEQLPTRVETVVELNDDGECVFAGVVAVQPLPFASEETLDKVWTLDPYSLLDAVKEEGVEKATESRFGGGEEVWELREAKYKCNCSRRYLLRVLVSLGEEQMRAIIKEDGAVRVHCHYCNSDYEFTEEDADVLFPHS